MESTQKRARKHKKKNRSKEVIVQQIVAPSQKTAPKRPRTARPRHSDSYRPKNSQMHTAEKEALREIVAEKEVEVQVVAAKVLPGMFHTGFSAGGNVIDTVPIVGKSARIINQAWDAVSSTMANLGTRDFLMIAHCPSMTLFHGVGGAVGIPTTTKMGGVSIIQTDNLASPFHVGYFDDALSGKTMDQIYGSDGAQLTNSAFVWASLLTFSMISQAIGATGVAYFGVLPYSSLATEDGTLASFSFDDLIKMSRFTKSFTASDKSFSLQNALQLNTIVDCNSRANNDERHSRLNAELVTYVVLQKPFTKFQDGTNQTFSLAVQTRCNAAGFARTDDAFAKVNAPVPLKGQRGLQAHPHFTQGLPLKGIPDSAFNTVRNALSSAGVNIPTPIIPPELLDSTVKNYSQSSGWMTSALRKISQWYSSNKNWIDPVAHIGASFLLADREDGPYVDVDMLRSHVTRDKHYYELLPAEVGDPICDCLAGLSKTIEGKTGMVPLSDLIRKQQPQTRSK